MTDAPDYRAEKRMAFLALLFLMWMTAIFIRLLTLQLPSLFNRLLSLAGSAGVQLLIALTVIVLGVMAFVFKRRNQFWYGIIEASFGAASTITLVFSSTPSDMHLSQWAGLVGCAYVIARGTTNVSEALGDPDPSDFTAVFTERFQQGPKLI